MMRHFGDVPDTPYVDMYIGMSYSVLRDGDVAMDVRVFSTEKQARIWSVMSDVGSRCAVFKVGCDMPIEGRVYAVIVFKTENGKLMVDPGIKLTRDDALIFAGEGDHGLRYVIFERKVDSIASDSEGEWGECRRG
ncbi:MAG: hypothetical protein IJV02_05395 [Candidatus Methanomethylophilaceae archaeon]|nr:hypothetical protein [Candidatus Methanomethylophilaceae archaeon]